MASDSERVTIRIPTERLDVLNGLVKDGRYDTISDVIRAAIDNFLENQFAPEYIKRLTIELPKGNVVKLEELVQSGDSVSLEDAIRNAVREYIRRKVSKAVEKYKEK
jgi:Arc/MetJ-type ribon-helix-helix transcriptional regulator